MKKRIVIIGGGFGGVYTAKHLARHASKNLEIILISERNYFLFTPLLHEVATGSLSPTSVTEPLREIFRKGEVKIKISRVSEINKDDGFVMLGSEQIKFDYLVIATGAKINDFGLPGVLENTIGLKSLEDAIEIRKKVIEIYERELTEVVNRKEKLLNLVIIGGGPTGVELAAELDDFVSEIENDYKKSKKSGLRTKIYLINSADELLVQFPKSLRDEARRVLEKKRIGILNNFYVNKVEKGKIFNREGEEIRADLIVWTAGVMPNTKNGQRVLTNEKLQVLGYEKIFAMGDMGNISKLTNPLPMLAQVAVAEAPVVANNILALINKKPLQDFDFESKGLLVSLGKFKAVGQISGITITGFLAWFIWRTIYLFKFNSWKKRFRIMFEWTISLFSPRDITQVKWRIKKPG